eukprot:TRINITY_DN16227_c0_g1::TRINITY_DN16227_c0_g1_i1::g.3214::m.3214 TRINITY_DN16227_c0_g1::TRINITY_DN16227_c0_g1_i1::g.3214  ORF type:complete len:116 (+),score=2.39 TRINITY_DN16227_c0_g1_i1:207-554(+)
MGCYPGECHKSWSHIQAFTKEQPPANEVWKSCRKDYNQHLHGEKMAGNPDSSIRQQEADAAVKAILDAVQIRDSENIQERHEDVLPYEEEMMQLAKGMCATHSASSLTSTPCTLR